MSGLGSALHAESRSFPLVLKPKTRTSGLEMRGFRTPAAANNSLSSFKTVKLLTAFFVTLLVLLASCATRGFLLFVI